MTNREVQNKLVALGNYDTRLAAAQVVATEKVEAMNERQIHAVRVSRNGDHYYLNFLAKRSPELPTLEHRSLVVEIAAFEPKHLSKVVQSLSEEQRRYPHAGCLERQDSFLTRMLKSGKVRFIEARGIEFQDQDWEPETDAGFSAEEAYFLGCTFQNFSVRGVNLAFALFRQCRFGRNCNFDEAILCGSRFTEKSSFDKSFRAQEADCRYVDFYDAEVAGDFQKADLRGLTSDSLRYLGYHWIWGGRRDTGGAVTRQFWQVDFRSARLDVGTHKALCTIGCPISSGFLIGMKKFFLVTVFLWGLLMASMFTYRLFTGANLDVLGTIWWSITEWSVLAGLLYVAFLFCSATR